MPAENATRIIGPSRGENEAPSTLGYRASLEYYLSEKYSIDAHSFWERLRGVTLSTIDDLFIIPQELNRTNDSSANIRVT